MDKYLFIVMILLCIINAPNNDVYGRERNPSLNAVGFSVGIQL